MSRLIFYILALAYLFLAPSLLQASVPDASVSHDTIYARGSDNYPPFEFINKKGQPDGFNVEIFEAVMKTVGLNYKIGLGEWDEVISDIQNNRADVLVGMIYSKERAANVRFCIPHCTVNRNIICRQESDLKTVESIRNKEIIVQKGGWSQNFVRNNHLTDKMIEVNDMTTALKLLSDGKYDVAIGSDLVALSAIKEGSYNNLKIHLMNVEPQSYSIVVNRENDILLRLINMGLQELKVSGEYDQIYNKWFGVYSGNTEDSRIYYQMLAIGLSVIVLLLLITYILRAQIRRATRKQVALNKELQATLAIREDIALALKMALNAASLQSWYYDVDKDIYFRMENDTFVPADGCLKQRLYEDEVSDYEQIMNSLIEGEEGDKNGIFRFKHDGTGDYNYYEMCFIAVRDESGKTRRIAINLRDVTQRHLRQLKIESAFRSLEMAIGVSQLTAWEFDLTTFTYNILYGKAYQDVSFEDFDLFIHPEDRKAYRNFAESIGKGEREKDTMVIRMRKEDTDIYGYLECNIASIKNRSGVIVGLIGSFRDISEQKKYELDIIEKQHELEIAKEHAERSDHLKSAFLANMSHEIRTPLNAIVGFSELIIATDNEVEREEYSRLVSKNNDLLLKLINDILDLSKIESGYVELTMEYLDFAQFFEDVGAIIRPHIPSNIEFVCERPYQKCMIEFDKDKAMQVFNNLLTNAIKFTSKGFIRMGYECTENSLKFYIADSGIGIAKENIPKVFTRFEKVDAFTQGTGLGMAICKAIVESIGGNIEIESELGKGTTVWVWIPCRTEIINVDTDLFIPD